MYILKKFCCKCINTNYILLLNLSESVLDFFSFQVSLCAQETLSHYPPLHSTHLAGVLRRFGMFFFLLENLVLVTKS